MTAREELRMLNGSLQYAIRAFKREVFGFQFDYPVAIIEETGREKSLDYYLWSESLFLDDLVFDFEGVAQKRYRAQGPQYNPLFIAWFGLFSLHLYLQEKNEVSLKRFSVQIDWLKNNFVRRPDGAVVWPCNFDWQEGRARLETGWISAMYQSVVISALIRAYRLGGETKLLELCRDAIKVFHKTVEQGGVKTFEDGFVLYEEYPVYPLPRVLDGFLFSLLGLYDLATETDDPDIHRLFSEGVQGLKHRLHSWDYRGKWTWYGSHGYLCPPHYHTLNYLLLGILGRLTDDATLMNHAARWNVRNLSLLSKAEIYVIFLLSKNMARLRLPRNY